MSTLAPTAQTKAWSADAPVGGVQQAGAVLLDADNTAAAVWAPSAQTVATSSAATR
jgi:hypothetical protein